MSNKTKLVNQLKSLIDYNSSETCYLLEFQLWDGEIVVTVNFFAPVYGKLSAIMLIGYIASDPEVRCSPKSLVAAVDYESQELFVCNWVADQLMVLAIGSSETSPIELIHRIHIKTPVNRMTMG